MSLVEEEFIIVRALTRILQNSALSQVNLMIRVTNIVLVEDQYIFTDSVYKAFMTCTVFRGKKPLTLV